MAKQNIPKKSESIRARMHRFINSKKELSVAEFERSINLSNGFVNGIGDSIRRISLEKIKKVYPELNTNWLLTGEGEMIQKVSNEDHEKINVLKEPEAQYGPAVTNDLAMKTVFELTASNKILAAAHDKQAEANWQQSMANRELSEANKILVLNVSKLIENVGQQTDEALESRFSALLVLLKEVATGERYDGPGAVEARYAQIWDTLMKADRNRSIQTEKGTANK